MPNLPGHACRRPGCPEIVPRGVKYCDRHARGELPEPCRHAGCARLVKWPDHYCRKHKAEHLRHYRTVCDARRGTTDARGYGSKWRKRRKVYLGEHPLCERCEGIGQVKAAAQVHHVDGNTRNNADDNLLAVCVKCHAALEREKHGDHRQSGKG